MFSNLFSKAKVLAIAAIVLQVSSAGATSFMNDENGNLCYVVRKTWLGTYVQQSFKQEDGSLGWCKNIHYIPDVKGPKWGAVKDPKTAVASLVDKDSAHAEAGLEQESSSTRRAPEALINRETTRIQ